MSRPIDPFKVLLLNLSRGLRSKDVDALKYLADLGDAVAEDCDNGLDVFRVLERSGSIARNNVDFLKEFLTHIDRHDLISLIGIAYHTFYLLTK